MERYWVGLRWAGGALLILPGFGPFVLVVLDCDGIMVHLALWSPVLFLVHTRHYYFIVVVNQKHFCILNADGNTKILHSRADIITLHIVPRCFMPEVSIFTHRVGANIWQEPVCWEPCPWHCSSVHRNSSRSWNPLSPFLRFFLFKFFKCLSPLVQKLDCLLKPTVPCPTSLHKDHLSILSQNGFSYGCFRPPNLPFVKQLWALLGHIFCNDISSICKRLVFIQSIFPTDNSGSVLG